jgi:hypothetical protein
MTAVRVRRNVRYDIEIGSIEQGAILARIQTAMIEWIAFQLAEGASFFISAREHQGGARRGMSLKPCEHGTLIVGREMKKAVPSEQPPETPIQGKLAHVHQMSGRLR